MDNELYIQRLLDEALEILRPMKIYYTTKAGNNTRALVEVVKELYPLIKDDYPVISDILESVSRNLIGNNGCINAYSFGDLRTSIQTLYMLYSYPCIKRKIFISHSSKDKDIVSEFCDRILRLGIGLSADDIFCTSIEDMNIKYGDDIRNHIKENILSADFSLLLISENYKNSEICLNEMGAVWATDNNVRYYLLPNTGFDKIGWLCDTNQAEQLIDHIALDKLYNELTQYYGLNVKLETWSRQRLNFIEVANKQNSAVEKDVKTKEAIERLLDSLSDFDKKHLLEWANVDDGECWIIESMDGTTIEIGEAEYSINNGREKAEWDAFFERMNQLDFATVDRLNSDGSPIYKLKKAAYKYVDKIEKLY